MRAARLARPCRLAAARRAPPRARLSSGLVDVPARRAEVEAAVSAAASKHGELVAYLSDAMAAASLDGDAPALRPASSFEEPADAEEAFRVQQAVVRRIKERHPALRHVGYKLGGTSEAARQRLGLEQPFVGPVFANRVFASGVRLPAARLGRETVKGVELELGFRTSLAFFQGEFYSARAVKESLDDLWAVAELPAHRFTPDSEVSGLMTIADCGGTGLFVLANRFPHNWDQIDDVSKVYCDLVRGEDEVVQKGIGQNVMDTPINAASFAANFFAQTEAETLPSGVMLSTGAMTELQPVAPGEVYRGLFKRDEERPVGWLGFTIEK